MKHILQAIQEAGGRPMLVGGHVRDTLMQLPSKDIDVEVYGLSLDELETCLKKFGEVDLVGRAFGILKIHNLKVNGAEVDFSVPRSDNKVGIGHKDFHVTVDKNMSMEEAASRRDLTINSMAMDPFTLEVFDPFGGRKDIASKTLRATNPNTFLEDPLRALRVAQFASRLRFIADQELVLLCHQADLSHLSGERIFTEFVKLLLGKSPARGFIFMEEANLLRFFPEIQALSGLQQDPEWHPEGDVFQHTLLTVEAARKMSDDLTIMFASLCHDFGKVSTTEKCEDGHIRSLEHEEKGEEPTRNFLGRMKAPNDLIEKVVALVTHHLIPQRFCKVTTPAGPSAYRRLARKLDKAGTNINDLYLVAKADHLGRTTPDALTGEFTYGDIFLAKSKEVKVEIRPEPDVCLGRHLIARGYKPGPEIGKILAKCRDLQYEQGLKDPDQILTIVLEAPRE